MIRLLLIVAAIVAVGASSASAADSSISKTSSSAAGAIQLNVVAIEMSKGAASVDRRLAHLKKYFAKSFRDYKTFRHLSSHDLALAKGKAATQLVNGKRLEAKYLGRPDKLMRVEVKFDGARMTMKVRDAGLWFHAGRRTRDGKVTVLALTARTKRP